MTQTISRSELKAKIDRGDDFRLVETLPREYFRKEHLPGAINLPPAETKERAPELLPEKQDEIVVYCANSECTASDEAGKELTELGYRNVRRYVEGKQDWIDAGLPTESEQAGVRS